MLKSGNLFAKPLSIVGLVSKDKWNSLSVRIFSAFSHYLVFITVYLDVRIDELYLRELLQLEVHPADLGVEGVVVEQVQWNFLSWVWFIVIIFASPLNISIYEGKVRYLFQITFEKVPSSATSGPLLLKFPCLVTETRVLMSPVTVTASSLSVFRKIM